MTTKNNNNTISALIGSLIGLGRYAMDNEGSEEWAREKAMAAVTASGLDRMVYSREVYPVVQEVLLGYWLDSQFGNAADDPAHHEALFELQRADMELLSQRAWDRGVEKTFDRYEREEPKFWHQEAYKAQAWDKALVWEQMADHAILGLQDRKEVREYLVREFKQIRKDLKETKWVKTPAGWRGCSKVGFSPTSLKGMANTIIDLLGQMGYTRIPSYYRSQGKVVCLESPKEAKPLWDREEREQTLDLID